MKILVQSSVWDGLENGRSKASSVSKCLCAHVGNAGLHRQLPVVAAPLRIKALRRRKKAYLVAVQGTSWGCRLCGWLGRQALAGTGGGDSSLNVRLGNSKRLASFPGFWSAGTAKGLGNHLLPPFIHSFLFNIY